MIPSRKSSTAALTAALLALLVESANAQPTPDPNEKEAVQHYQKGQAAYDLGHYDEAIVEWEKSYKLSKKPLLLFNLGQAARRKKDCQRALDYYKSYLRAAPGAEHEAEAQGFVTEMEKCVAKQPKKPPAKKPLPDKKRSLVQPSPGERDTGKRPGRMKKWIGLTLIGVGVLAGGTGVYFGMRADAEAKDVSDVCNASGGCEWSDVASKESAGKRAEKVQWALYGVGAAAVMGGAIIYYLGARGRSSTPGAVAVEPRQGGAVFVLGGEW